MYRVAAWCALLLDHRLNDRLWSEEFAKKPPPDASVASGILGLVSAFSLRLCKADVVGQLAFKRQLGSATGLRWGSHR